MEESKFYRFHTVWVNVRIVEEFSPQVRTSLHMHVDEKAPAVTSPMTSLTTHRRLRTENTCRDAY